MSKIDALTKTLEGVETVSVIHAAFDEKPHVVAMVEVKKSSSFIRKCEVAFVKTNSINDAWWKNEGVTPMFPEKGCRSTSVGDRNYDGESVMNEKLKAMREASLIEEINSNSLQIEQLSEDVRGLMYAIRDLTEQLAVKEAA